MPLKVYLFSSENLADYFGRFGELKTCRIIYKHESNVSRGFGFIVFKHKGAAEKVIDMKDEHYIKGVWVDCKPAILRREMDHHQHGQKPPGQAGPYPAMSPPSRPSPERPSSPIHPHSPANRSPGRVPPPLYPQESPRILFRDPQLYTQGYQSSRPRQPLRGDMGAQPSPPAQYGYYHPPQQQLPPQQSLQQQYPQSPMSRFKDNIPPIQTNPIPLPYDHRLPSPQPQHSPSPPKLNQGFVLQSAPPPDDPLANDNKHVMGYLRHPLGLSFSSSFFPPQPSNLRPDVASSKNSPKQVEYKKYYSPTQKHRHSEFPRFLPVREKVIKLKPESPVPGGSGQPPGSISPMQPSSSS